MTDTLGDRCKEYELAEAGRRAMRGLPLLARLDGRAFHTFTRGMARPYSTGMMRCMRETTAHLVDKFHAKVGYTQSDEITLAWYEPADSVSEYLFDGRFQKIASVLAGAASVAFYKAVRLHLPDKQGETPHFDCRVWQVPNLREASLAFLWREDDATKNSITMAASAFYSHTELHGKNSADKHEMLHAKGVNWNDYPAHFKRGIYLQRQGHHVSLSLEELARIPEAHQPLGGVVWRTSVIGLDLPPIRQVTNREAVLFEGAHPQTALKEAV